MNTRPYSFLAIALSLCVQAIFVSPSIAGENDRITEQKILSIEQALDDALMQRNVAAYVSRIADIFVYTFERTGPTGKSVIKMTRSEYEAGLAKSLQTTKFRSISHQERVFTIAEDGREASVTQKNSATLTGGEKDIRASTVATYKYAMRDGVVLLLSLAESNYERQELEASFHDVDFAPYRGEGPSSLEGEAFVKTENGEVRNCSGEAVFLAPYTPFDIDVITAFLFHIDLALKKAGQAAPYWRESSCDSQGKFEFTDVPIGTWIVITAVRWGNSGRVIGGQAEGGQLAKKITLRPGKNKVSLNMKNLKHPMFGFDLK